MIQSLGLVLNISHFRRGETWSKDGTPELPQKETVDTTHMMDIVGTSFVLSGQGRRVYLALWDAQVRRLHISPQSGLPRIRTQDLKVF